MTTEGVLRRIAYLAGLASDMDCPDAHGELLDELGIDQSSAETQSMGTQRRSVHVFKLLQKMGETEANRIRYFDAP